MNKSSALLCFCLLLSALTLYPGFATAVADAGGVEKQAPPPAEKSASVRFNELNTLIRDGRIGRNDAVMRMSPLLKELRAEYVLRGGRDHSRHEWVFPLAGYDQRAITGGRNKGYISSGYDYFTGNRHGGHPSFDIFIRDRNRDSVDDRTGEQVKVLSLTGGIVAALEKDWEQGSRLRGGIYLWVYDPVNELLVYYAHNSKLSVGLGDVVKPGDVLATVGRSGLNAFKRRSPTHLHLTVLEMKNGRPVPLNVYRDLAASIKK